MPWPDSGSRACARTRILEAETIRRAAKGQESAIWLDSADEAFEELADVLLDGHLLCSGEELDDELEETLGEVLDEALTRYGPPLLLWRGIWGEELLAEGVGGGDGRVGEGGGHGRAGNCAEQRAIRPAD